MRLDALRGYRRLSCARPPTRDACWLAQEPFRALDSQDDAKLVLPFPVRKSIRQDQLAMIRQREGRLADGTAPTRHSFRACAVGTGTRCRLPTIAGLVALHQSNLSSLPFPRETPKLGPKRPETAQDRS